MEEGRGRRGGKGREMGGEGRKRRNEGKTSER